MFTTADLLVSLERSRAGLNKTGQERLAQLNILTQTGRKTRKKMPPRQKDACAAVGSRCCQAASL